MQTLQIRNSTAEFLIFTKQNKERTIEVIVDEDSPNYYKERVRNYDEDEYDNDDFELSI